MVATEESSAILEESRYTYAPTTSLVAQSALRALQERLASRLGHCNDYDSDGSNVAPTLRLQSMKESFDLELLTQFYDELMIPNFPLEEERDDLEDWLLCLDPSKAQERDNGEDETSMDVLILTTTTTIGDNDDNKKSTTVLGGIAFEYYPLAQAGLLSYMVVSTDFRRLGILGTLHPVFCHAVQALHQVATQTDTKINAILAETNTATAGDVPPPVARKRHEILFKLGYRLLQFPYVQPPLATDVDSFDDIMLLIFVGSNSSGGAASAASEQKEVDNENMATTSTNQATTTTPMTSVSTQVLYNYVLDFYHSVFGTDVVAFQDHWYYQLVTWYHQRYPSTNIQQDLPWDDVTPKMMEERQQDLASKQETT